MLENKSTTNYRLLVLVLRAERSGFRLTGCYRKIQKDTHDEDMQN